MQLPTTTTTLHGLREIDLHSWEGRSKAELKVEQPEAYAAWEGNRPAGDLVVDGKRPIVDLWRRAQNIVWPSVRVRDECDAPDSTHTLLI